MWMNVRWKASGGSKFKSKEERKTHKSFGLNGRNAFWVVVLRCRSSISLAILAFLILLANAFTLSLSDWDEPLFPPPCSVFSFAYLFHSFSFSVQCGNIVYISFQFLCKSSNINKRLPLSFDVQWLAWNGNDCQIDRTVRENQPNLTKDIAFIRYRNEHLISLNVIYANERQWTSMREERE